MRFVLRLRNSIPFFYDHDPLLRPIPKFSVVPMIFFVDRRIKE